MAPRQSIRARAAKASKPSISSTSTSAPTPLSTSPDDTPFSSIPTTKKDKQRIKHSLLLSKVSKSAGAGSKKRRRPNKQLVASLESLADALPDDVQGGGAGGVGEEGERVELGQARVMRQRSLRSRPGAMKRKERMERVERERFGQNLARIQAGQGQRVESGLGAVAAAGAGAGAGAGGVAAAGVAPTADRWAALRGFIQGTMERKEEFRTG